MSRGGRFFRAATSALTVGSRALTSASFNQTFNPDGSSGTNWIFGSRTKAAAEMTSRRALQLIAVYSCVNLLADTVAGFDLEVVRKSSDGTTQKLAVPAWAQTPNASTLPFSFIHQGMVSVLLTGDAFIYVERDSETAAILGLHILHPEMVQVQWLNGVKVFRVGGEVLINGFDVIHVPGFMLPGEIRGLSPIGLAKEAIGLGLTAEEYGARFFENGAHMSGVVEAPNKLDEESAKLMAKTLSRSHSGKDAFLPGVLTNGAKWHPISVHPEQAQFLETRAFQKADIALLFRVPAYMVDASVTSSWGTGITEQNRGLSQFTLAPWVTRFEQALSQLLPRGQSFVFNMDGLLRGTTKERYEVYTLGVTGGWLSTDDVREMENLNPLADGKGEKYYHPANQIELGVMPPTPPPTGAAPIKPDTPAPTAAGAK